MLTIICRKLMSKSMTKAGYHWLLGFFLNTNLKVVLITMQFLDFTNTKNVKNYEKNFFV